MEPNCIIRLKRSSTKQHLNEFRLKLISDWNSNVGSKKRWVIRLWNTCRGSQAAARRRRRRRTLDVAWLAFCIHELNIAESNLIWVAKNAFAQWEKVSRMLLYVHNKLLHFSRNWHEMPFELTVSRNLSQTIWLRDELFIVQILSSPRKTISWVNKKSW